MGTVLAGLLLQLSIAAALFTLQLPELALPKLHGPIIGQQYLGKQSDMWKEMLWVAGQACQTPFFHFPGVHRQSPKQMQRSCLKPPRTREKPEGPMQGGEAHAPLSGPLLHLGNMRTEGCAYEGCAWATEMETECTAEM